MKPIPPPIIALLAMLCWLPSPPHAQQPPRIPVSHDLTAAATAALRGERILLLLVSRDGCGFCEVIKREVLNPMVLSGDYVEQVVFRELFIDIGERIVDFDGAQGSASDFADVRKISLTPTLLFLAPDGRELTERIIGVRTLSMLPSYVDAAIEHAIRNLRSAANTR